MRGMHARFETIEDTFLVQRVWVDAAKCTTGTSQLSHVRRVRKSQDGQRGNVCH